jgi:hypothetical protein
MRRALGAGIHSPDGDAITQGVVACLWRWDPRMCKQDFGIWMGRVWRNHFMRGGAVNRQWIVLVIALAFFITGCGLSPHARDEGKRVGQSIDEMKKFIAERESAYAQLCAGERQWLAPYAEREKWRNKITEAQAETMRLESVFANYLKPLLGANKHKSEDQVLKLIRQLEKGLEQAKDLARYPSIRAGELETVKAKAPEMHAQAMEDYAKISIIAPALKKYIADVQSAHKDAGAAIEKHTGNARKMAAEAEQASAAIQAQFANRLAGRDTDYAVFADAGKLLRSVRETLPAEDNRIRRECPELDQSFSRTLIDMKQRYWVYVSQVSWEESEWIENPMESKVVRNPIEVSEDIYNQLDALPDDQPIATLRSGFFGGFNPKISEPLLHVLNLSSANAREEMPSGDNEADYEIDSIRVDSYHRYAEERNGVIKETDWTPVSVEYYEDHFNDLGMALDAKPYGRFADEIEEEPAPAGMAYVGNPRYGRWQTGAGGASFWEFYGQYAFFRMLLGMGHPGYSRTEWGEYRTYRDRDEAYYGGTGSNVRYGSASSTIQTNPRFAGTTFARTGGFRSAQADIRTAGVSARGGGPGGGGK